ncbi:hypothetical protein KM043_003799 [Ampulex compressa]|nr:hypothetical protein KM043_003799 [Ampulex compressa]
MPPNRKKEIEKGIGGMGGEGRASLKGRKGDRSEGGRSRMIRRKGKWHKPLRGGIEEKARSPWRVVAAARRNSLGVKDRASWKGRNVDARTAISRIVGTRALRPDSASRGWSAMDRSPREGRSGAGGGEAASTEERGMYTSAVRRHEPTGSEFIRLFLPGVEKNNRGGRATRSGHSSSPAWPPAAEPTDAAFRREAGGVETSAKVCRENRAAPTTWNSAGECGRIRGVAAAARRVVWRSGGLESGARRREREGGGVERRSVARRGEVGGERSRERSWARESERERVGGFEGGPRRSEGGRSVERRRNGVTTRSGQQNQNA